MRASCCHPPSANVALREAAIRNRRPPRALGTGRGRLVRQHLAESGVLIIRVGDAMLSHYFEIRAL